MMNRISSTATRSDHQRVCTITEALIDQKAADARNNARRREIHMFHQDNADPLQRMLNAMQPGSYVQPHRHADSKAEGFVVLRGSVGFVEMDDNGQVDDAGLVLISRESGNIGLDCRGGTWHTFFALEPDTVIFEIKSGPFDAKTDKQFAEWAPAENTTEALVYLAELEDRIRRRFQLGRREWEIPR